jgi:ATP-dependent Lon protease
VDGQRAKLLASVLTDFRDENRSLLSGSLTMLDQLDALKNEAPNFEAALGIVRRAAHRSLNNNLSPMRIPPMVLLGPPSVGKTFLARRLAQAIATEICEISTNLVDEVGTVVGHTSSWRSARAGVIATTLLEGGTAAPIMFVDEVDKAPRTHAGDDALTIFHSLLEPENSCAFVDAYLNFPIRADHVVWIMTANDLSNVVPSILDRMLVVQITEPSVVGRTSIIRSIYRLAAEEQCLPPDVEIDSDAIHELLEASPRQVKRITGLAFGFSAERGRRGIGADDARARRIF